MNKIGPIIIIEDDLDDRELLEMIFTRLNYPNEVLFFDDGLKALEYLEGNSEKPFLILSDINLPKITGPELKEKIKNNSDLHMKCIPYLFFTTSAGQRDVIDAYSKSVQGFFIKPSTLAELEKTISTIVEYWKICSSPNYIRV